MRSHEVATVSVELQAGHGVQEASVSLPAEIFGWCSYFGRSDFMFVCSTSGLWGRF